MTKVVNLDADLATDERNLLSVAYKNTISPFRSAMRALSSIEKKEEQKGSKNIGLLLNYRGKAEEKLDKYCKDLLDLIDNKLIPNASNVEAEVFYWKMKADYYRYICEHAKENVKD